MTEAQNKATANYRRKNVRQICIRFYPSEMATYEHAKSLKPAGIKALIERDRVK